VSTETTQVVRTAAKATVMDLGGKWNHGDTAAVAGLVVLAFLAPPFALAGMTGYGISRAVTTILARVLRARS